MNIKKNIRKNINRHKFDNYTPPGIAFAGQFRLFLLGLGIAVIWSLGYYFIRYFIAYENLYVYRMSKKVLRENAVMTDFHVLLEDGVGCFTLFLVFYLVMCGLVVFYYLTYYQGSRSIYLMRRLPDRWELYRRCIVLPAAMILLGVVTQFALWMLYYGVYLTYTPEQCLPVWYR